MKYSIQRALSIPVLMLTLAGCGSGSTGMPSGSDTTSDDPTEPSAFLPKPSTPYPESSESEVISRAREFESSLEQLVTTYFEQVNDVIAKLSQGAVSHADTEIAEIDTNYFNQVLSECTFDYATDGVEITDINCNGMVFLDFRLRHPIYNQVDIQLRSGSISNTADTPLRYELVIRQFNGLSETQMKVVRTGDTSYDLDYGLVDSVDCSRISVLTDTVSDTDKNRCAAALAISTGVLVRLNADTLTPDT